MYWNISPAGGTEMGIFRPRARYFCRDAKVPKRSPEDGGQRKHDKFPTGEIFPRFHAAFPPVPLFLRGCSPGQLQFHPAPIPWFCRPAFRAVGPGWGKLGFEQPLTSSAWASQLYGVVPDCAVPSAAYGLIQRAPEPVRPTERRLLPRKLRFIPRSSGAPPRTAAPPRRRRR